MTRYNSDSPISSSSEDKYCRAGYADKIADALTELDCNRSYVVALYAKWGYGKTSVLNMVRSSLLEKDNILILDLEPWGYTTSQDLAAGLLCQILNRLSQEIKNKNKDENSGKIKCARKRITNCCKAWRYRYTSKAHDGLAEMAREANHVGIQAVSAVLAGLSSMHYSYREIRSEIERELKTHNKRIIVMVDDIDRLSPQEMLDTFKLIRSVANIKGVTYFLAFDDEIVSTAISETLPHKEGGRDYVDKIVQIPLELPLIDDNELRDRLQEGITEILKDNGIEIAKTELNEISTFCYYIMPQLNTPRTVIRCLNVLRFTIPLLLGEVSISDTVRIELLRITIPELYQKIKNNRSLLTANTAHYTQDQNESRQKHLADLFSSDELLLIHCLFPNMIGNQTLYYQPYDEKQARQQKRICTAAYFNRYFTYAIGSGDVADREIVDTLCRQTNQKSIDLLFKKNAYGKVIEKIRDNSDMIQNPDKFCVQLVLAAEKAVKPTDEGMNHSQIEAPLRVVDEIIFDKKIGSACALNIYKNIAQQARYLNTLAYAIRLVAARCEHGQQDKQILSSGDYIKYKSFILEILENKMTTDQLPTNLVNSAARELYTYLQKFSESSDKINAYMRQKVKTADQALDFITQFLDEWIDMKTGLEFRSDFLDPGSSSYKYWFIERFDAEYLYDLLIRNKRYKRYHGISLDEVERFDRFDENDASANIVGNERSEVFRDIIAQQFIYLFEANQREITEPSA